MGKVLLYDVEVQDDREQLVFMAKSIRGASNAHELIASYYRVVRSPGSAPGHSAHVICRTVDGRSLHVEGRERDVEPARREPLSDAEVEAAVGTPRSGPHPMARCTCEHVLQHHLVAGRCLERGCSCDGFEEA